LPIRCARSSSIADDLRGGVAAFQAGRLSVRRDLPRRRVLAATSGASEQGRLRFRTLATKRLAISAMEAGQGPAVLALHGLGATKGSFLPTLAALADHFRVIAIDLPGFGDSDKPIGAPYDPRFFARTVVDVLDALAAQVSPSAVSVASGSPAAASSRAWPSKRIASNASSPSTSSRTRASRRAGANVSGP
jgi:pimeloyl-ACP methyl ester carboxylesterase